MSFPVRGQGTLGVLGGCRVQGPEGSSGESVFLGGLRGLRGQVVAWAVLGWWSGETPPWAPESGTQWGAPFLSPVPGLRTVLGGPPWLGMDGAAAALTLGPAGTRRSGEAVRAQVGCWSWMLGPHLWVGFEAEPEGVSECGRMRHKSGPWGPHTKRQGAENRGRDLEGAARPRRVGLGSCSHRPGGPSCRQSWPMSEATTGLPEEDGETEEGLVGEGSPPTLPELFWAGWL